VRKLSVVSKSLGIVSPVIALFFAGSLSLFAQSQPADRQFAAAAASGGQEEVKLGQLAQENGQSQTVKDFGERMVRDHSKADQDLNNAAQKDDIRLPQKLTPNEQANYDRLAKLRGAQFDKAYARLMVQDHKQDIADFEKEASQGQSNSVKGFAQQTLPTLKAHLRAAEQMEKSVSANG
jgi:putative membrane protein